MPTFEEMVSGLFAELSLEIQSLHSRGEPNNDMETAASIIEATAFENATQFPADRVIELLNLAVKVGELEAVEPRYLQGQSSEFKQAVPISRR